MSQAGRYIPLSGPGSGTVTSISAGTGITLTPNPITTTGTVALTIPVTIADGGTNATSMTNTDGVVYFDGTKLNTTTVGTAAQVLTSNGAGMAPTFQNPAASSITIAGDSGGGLTGNSFTFTGSTTGLTFAGAGTTETLGGTLVVGNGGTGATTFTSHGVLLGNTTSAITATAAGTTGQVLTGVTGSAPTFQSPAASSITISGDSGGGLTGSSFTFTASGIGLSFAGSGSTETLGGVLKLANGGTNANLTASNGGIFYSTSTAGAILAGTATADQVLLSGSSTTPAWSTATYPATTTINQLLYSSSNNVIAGVTAGDYGVLISSSSGVPSWLANGTTGQILTATTSGTPSWENAAASGITTIDGDTGSVTGSTVSITGETTAGVTVSFQGSGTAMTFNVEDGNANMAIGIGAGHGTFSSGANNNVFLGQAVGYLITGANQYNVGVGSNAFRFLTSGSGNCAVGQAALYGITSGINNVAIGSASSDDGVGGAGQNYTSSESNNICIGSPGVVSENHTLHIGNGTGTGAQQLNKAYISGITGIATSGSAVIVSSSNQLGVNGAATNTGQPCFSAYANAESNVTGDGTTYNVLFQNALVNQGSAFNTTTGIFTAPVTGNYQFNFVVQTDGYAVANTIGLVEFIAGGNTTQFGYCNPYVSQSSNGMLCYQGSILVPLTATQTAQVQLYVGSTTKGVGIIGAANYTIFSGYLVC